MQYVAVLTSSLMGSSSNMITTWNSPVIVKLTSQNSPIGVTLSNDQASWVASISSLGFIVGAIAAGPLLIYFGPKRMLLLAALPIFVTWMVIAFTKFATVLIVMRCISGIGDGIIIAVLPLYIGEISDKDIRGGLTIAISIMTTLGGAFVLSVGPFVSYKALTLSCAAVPLLFAILFIFLPDSPYFLFRKSKSEEARRTLRRLLQSTISEAIINERMREIELTITTQRKTKSYWKDIIFRRPFRKSMFLVLGATIVMEFSGMTVLKSYLQIIIDSSDSAISPEVSSIIFGVVQLPSIFLAAVLMDKLGRKPLYIISTIGCAIPLITAGTYFYLEKTSIHLLANLKWLPTLCLALYIIIAPIGINVLPLVLISEVFPTEVKSLASSTCTTFVGLLSFAFNKFFLPLSDEWGMYTIFWIFGSTCIIGSLFGLFILPETKEKSFLEIQEVLKTKTCW
ncbi:hypothetical protein FQR65_LT13191 [Abscondita terminalis]|nr:hypothetical protein FQR65_LT13191 [Abscondita terminalis]